MLLQRLVRDETAGFNYDYMGAAEYEFGATRNGRGALATAFIEGKLHARPIQFREVHYGSVLPPVNVLAVGSKEVIDNIVAAGGKISVIKETFRTNDSNIVGWMNVGWEMRRTTPLLLVRQSLHPADITARTKKFLEPFIEQAREALEETG
jgi:hypothetical protein